MKKLLEAASAAALLLAATAARATPSTVVWTPATTYTQPFLVPHLTYDTYVGERSILQETWGVTVGFVPPNRWIEGEAGVDLMYPLLPTVNPTGATYESKTAFVFNAKLSLKEGALHAAAPGLSAGVYGVGLTSRTTDYDVFHAELGKTLGRFGTVAAGGYVGNSKDLVRFDAATGTVKKDNAGFIASYSSPKLELDTVGLKALSAGIDWQSGRNLFGALGAAVTFYFSDAISLLTGPVIFNDKYALAGVNLSRTFPAPADQSRFLWTVQLDVDLDFSRPKPAPRP